MNNGCIYDWKPIESILLFCATIDVLSQEIEQQYKILLRIKDNGYQLNKEHVFKIIQYYTKLVDKLMLYEAQLNKWKENQLSENQNDKIDLLLDKLLESRKMTQSIIQFSAMLQKNDDIHTPNSEYMKIESKAIELIH
jgi:hypothetical protein